MNNSAYKVINVVKEKIVKIKNMHSDFPHSFLHGIYEKYSFQNFNWKLFHFFLKVTAPQTK